MKQKVLQNTVPGRITSETPRIIYRYVVHNYEFHISVIEKLRLLKLKFKILDHGRFDSNQDVNGIRTIVSCLYLENLCLYFCN